MTRRAIAILAALVIFPVSVLARPPEVDQLASLYKELMRFRKEPLFKQVGFGDCCKCNRWLKRVEALRERGSSEMWLTLGVLPGDLWTLGWEYMHSKGAETEYTRTMVPNFESALFLKPAKKGFTGRMSDTDRYCKDLATYKRHQDLIAAQDYAGADRVISDDRACPLVQKNTPMRGPLDKKTQAEITYLLFDAQDIGKVWVMEDGVDVSAAK
jgi:hypothetical protein